LLKAAQHGHGVVCGLRLDVAAVEEVASHENEIYAARDCEALDHLSPGAEEIARAVGQVISFDAEMNIGYVKKPCHMNNQTLHISLMKVLKDNNLSRRSATIRNALGARSELC
jgi:hypothetical protein